MKVEREKKEISCKKFIHKLKQSIRIYEIQFEDAIDHAKFQKSIIKFVRYFDNKRNTHLILCSQIPGNPKFNAKLNGKQDMRMRKMLHS